MKVALVKGYDELVTEFQEICLELTALKNKQYVNPSEEDKAKIKKLETRYESVRERMRMFVKEN